MTKRTRHPGGDYAVGHGKPPAHSRFKTGQSGNPGGRRKGERNIRTILQAVVFEETVTLSEGGKKRKIPVAEALVKRQVQAGLNGDSRAIKDVLDRTERLLPPPAEIEEEPLESGDTAFLQRMLAVLRRRVRGAPASQEEPGPAPPGEGRERRTTRRQSGGEGDA